MENNGSKLSVCGYDCTKCPIYLATISRDLQKLKQILKKDGEDITVESVGCLGCFSEKVNHMCDTCFMKNCTKKRGIDSCGKSNNYPCDYAKKYLSSESIANLDGIKRIADNKRCAIIGMSGNSLFYDVEGEKATLVHEEVGGKGYNQAIACVRNGIKVSYLTAVGCDKTGEILERFMINEGIDTYFIKKNKPSLEASIYVDREGNNKVVYDQENVAILSREDVDGFEEEIKRSDCLLLQFEYPKEVIEEAIKLAKKYNKMIVINPAPMIYLDLDLVKEADFIIPNEEESYKLFGVSRNNSFNNVIEKEKKSGLKWILNTVGSKGVIAINGDYCEVFSPINVNPIDTTGAGDTFNGLFVATLLRGASVEASIRRAIIASGLSVTRKYVMDAIPNSMEIEEYIKRNKL